MKGSPDIRTRVQPVRISECTLVSGHQYKLYGYTTCIRIHQRPPTGNLNLNFGILKILNMHMHMHMHTALVQRTFRIENLSFPPAFFLTYPRNILDKRSSLITMDKIKDENFENIRITSVKVRALPYWINVNFKRTGQ